MSKVIWQESAWPTCHPFWLQMDSFDLDLHLVVVVVVVVVVVMVVVVASRTRYTNMRKKFKVMGKIW